MSKVVAIMSMSLDGFVADRNDGVGEVFDCPICGNGNPGRGKGTTRCQVPLDGRLSNELPETVPLTLVRRLPVSKRPTVL